MSTGKKFDEMVKRLGWRDMQCIKTSVFLIALPIGAYFSQYILPYWPIFVVLGILVALKPLKKSFGK